MQLTITQYKINDLAITCTSTPTRSGFAHIVNVCGGTFAKVKHNYLNRTWESFTYQSAILDALNKALAQTKKDMKDANSDEMKKYYNDVLNKINKTIKYINKHEPKKYTRLSIEY